MYKLGERSHHRSKLYLVLLFVFVFLVIGGYLAAKHFLRADTELSQSEGIIRHVDVVTPETKEVGGPAFSITIPKTWKAVKTQRIPEPAYAWQGTVKEETARWIEVYVDSIPATMAFNRLLPLTTSNGKLIVSDGVSDNCINFTDERQINPQTGKILAKWSGVAFYCDASNSSRNVTGTGSKDGINTITLKGPKTGTHKFLFVYTDHGANPDDNPFITILNSLKVK